MYNFSNVDFEKYLLELEYKLLNESEKLEVSLTRDWANSFPIESAVYLFRENDNVCYIGETGSLRGRMADVLNTKNHTLRRNVGNKHYSSFPNYEKASSKKGFSFDIEELLNTKIKTHFTVSYIIVNLGRKELEESLYYKLRPQYCIKGKRGKK